MASSLQLRTLLAAQFRLAAQGLGQWDRRRWLGATAFALGLMLLMGLSTVLIPNQFFSREIAPVWWNYPVWLITSIAAGMLAATYLRAGAAAYTSQESAPAEQPDAKRSSRLGIAGGLLAWFAVGCPVCNKIALLVLGYTGALTWFAPFQPVLAAIAMVLTIGALVVRLRGQVSCVVPKPAPFLA